MVLYITPFYIIIKTNLRQYGPESQNSVLFLWWYVLVKKLNWLLSTYHFTKFSICVSIFRYDHFTCSLYSFQFFLMRCRFFFLDITSRGGNPHPNPKSESYPIFGKKHNPHPNPQFIYGFWLLIFITFVAFFKKNSTYKILITINNLICCKFFSYAGSHRKFTSKSNKSRLKLTFTVAFMLILG